MKIKYSKFIVVFCIVFSILFALNTHMSFAEDSTNPAMGLSNWLSDGTFLNVVSGKLFHIIYTPLKNVAKYGNSTLDDFAGGVNINKDIDTKFDNFDEFGSDVADNRETFCQIGGQYRIRVIENLSKIGVPFIDNTYELFYCKTTLDLLKMIKLPSSWNDSNLIVYCNDGNKIKASSINYDILTSSDELSSYKTCIVKNTDKPVNNTIIYGFDVGNKIIDNSTSSFFNTTTHQGSIITGEFTYVNNISTVTRSAEVYGGEINVPYKTESGSGLCGTGDGAYSCDTSSTTKRNYDEALSYAKSQNSAIISLSNAEEHIEYVQCSGITDFDNGCDSSEITSASYTKYKYKVSQNYTYNKYLFNYTVEGNVFGQYYFTYDDWNKYFTLSNFDYDTYRVTNHGFRSNTVPFSSVFNISDIYTKSPLTRVALFKKTGNNFVYGYERAARLHDTIRSSTEYNDSIKDVYKIDMSKFAGFNQDKCQKMLNSWETALSTYDDHTQVSCDNNIISIVAENINAYGTDDSKDKTAYNLFKNIILSINVGDPNMNTTNNANPNQNLCDGNCQNDTNIYKNGFFYNMTCGSVNKVQIRITPPTSCTANKIGSFPENGDIPIYGAFMTGCNDGLTNSSYKDKCFMDSSKGDSNNEYYLLGYISSTPHDNINVSLYIGTGTNNSGIISVDPNYMGESTQIVGYIKALENEN